MKSVINIRKCPSCGTHIKDEYLVCSITCQFIAAKHLTVAIGRSKNITSKAMIIMMDLITKPKYSITITEKNLANEVVQLLEKIIYKVVIKL